MKISEKSVKATDYTHIVKSWAGNPLEESDYFKIVVRPKSFEDTLLLQDATWNATEDAKLSAMTQASLGMIKDRVLLIEFEYELDGQPIEVSSGETFIKNGPKKMQPNTCFNLYSACIEAIAACDSQSSQDTPAFLAQSDSPAGS